MTWADEGCVMAVESWEGEQKIFNHCSQETCKIPEAIQHEELGGDIRVQGRLS